MLEEGSGCSLLSAEQGGITVARSMKRGASFALLIASAVGLMSGCNPAGNASERKEEAAAGGEMFPKGFALVPAGRFRMGPNYWDQSPEVEVEVDAVYVGLAEVSWGDWRRVRDWGKSKGYVFDEPGDGVGDEHPVHSITWYDAIRWCNVLSEKEGRPAVYFQRDSDGAEQVFRAGKWDVERGEVKWTEVGYRLPSEAEWEKAARGGISGKPYPSGDELTEESANFQKGPSPDEPVPTMKVKSLKPNGYGLYDMAGNVWEWCWDWHASGYYGTIGKNPVGPQSGRMRVGRGGGWNNQSENCAVFYRDAFDPADSRTNYGFRLAVSARESGGEAATRVEK